MNVRGADPNVLFDKASGYYYAYATSNLEDRNAFYIYKSKDLVNWEFVNYALDLTKNNWGKDWFWAPECYYNENNKHYYLIYSSRIRDKELNKLHFNDENYFENCRIGIAVSKSPEGPFVNISDKPMEYFPYDPNYLNVYETYGFDNIFRKDIDLNLRHTAPKGAYLSTIDCNVFFDDDGRIYLFFSRCCYMNAVFDNKLNRFLEESNIAAVELTTDWWKDPEAKTMPTIKQEYIGFDATGKIRQDKFKEIINYHLDPQEWENGHTNDFELYGRRNRRWSEGSTTWTMNLDGKKTYCLTFSANNYENSLYGVGIAFSDNPLGPYKKFANNPVISQQVENSIYSTGHGCIVYKGDDMYYFHHARDDASHDRTLYVTKLDIKSKTDIKIGKIVEAQLMEKK